MLRTVSNPLYKCLACGVHWRSRPITFVLDEHLQLPACPACGGALEVAPFLASLVEDEQYNPVIADGVVQDNRAARERWFQAETANWVIVER